EPILLGNPADVRERASSLGIELEGIQVIDPVEHDHHEKYSEELYTLRQRHGVTMAKAHHLLHDPVYYGVMMLQAGEADGMVGGLKRSYPETIRPALEIIKLKSGVTRVAGLYCMVVKDRVLFFADATVNIEPTAEQLAEIALNAATIAKQHFDIEPRVAMLSFSNFGSVDHPFARRMADAARIARQQRPALVIDGEMAADTALVPEIV